MRKRLKDVLRYSNPLPFLVLRRLLPRYELPWTHAGESAWFIRKGIYNLVCSGLISLTGSILHRKNEGTPPWKDFRTSFHMQKNAKSDGYDMPLRYRQATPERRFPHDLNVRRQDDLSASVVVFACIENPIRDPIWLLPVSEVIKRLSDDNLKLLSDNKFEFFDNWTENWISEHAIRDQSVIEWVGPPDNRVCLLSYDMNRLNSLYAPTDSHYKEALGKLDHAIEVAGCDENSGAIPIVLTPGDVLVLDNARMMYARKEMPYASFRRLMVGRPAERYLRAYYGFPDAREILKRRSAGGEYPADRGLRMI
jgi:hypothetical protein